MALKYNPKSGHLKGTIRIGNERSVEIDNDLTDFTEEDLKSLQIEVWVMCGGGLLGEFGATRPTDFYIDDRVGRLPYPKRDIYQTVEVLKAGAFKLGKDPHNLPRPHICGAWVF